MRNNSPSERRRAPSDGTSRRGVLGAAALGLALFACGPPLDLPAIETVDIGDLDPVVREQIEQARQAVDSRPADAEANGHLGMLYELYQYPAAARAAYSRATILAPTEFGWHYYLGRLARREGDLDAAVTTLQAALALDPDYVPALTELGEAQLDREKLDAAEATFRRALAKAPASVAALTGLGRTLAARDDHVAALEAFAEALPVAPSHGPLHYAIGLSYRALGKPEKAEGHLTFASQIGPANPDPDPLATAILDLEVGVDRDYRDGKALYLQGRFPEAIERLQAVVEAQPDHAGAFGALGAALMESARDLDALAAFGRSVELNPDNVDISRPYALLLLRNRRFAEAEAQLRKVLARGADHPDDHHILGATLMGLGRPSAGIAEFERALELKPDHADARRALVQILWQQSSRAEQDLAAAPYLERLVELEPRHLQAWTVLGGIREGSGDLEGALRALERALEINPDLQPVVAKRAELLRRRAGGP